jgi:branched-chain amino acid transport system substrate-binding protein
MEEEQKNDIQDNPQTPPPTPVVSPTTDTAGPSIAATPPPEVAPKGSHKTGKWLLFIIVLIAVAAAAAGAWSILKPDKNKPASTVSTVKVGLLTPTTGTSVAVGNDRKRAIKLAQKDLNIQNVQIQLVVRDSECDSATAVKAFDDMVTKDHVVAVIGDDCSTSTLAAAKEAEKYHVVLISPAATSPGISDAGSYIFRTVPSDAQQGKFAANLIGGQKFKRVAVIHEDGAYGEGLATAFATNFQADGGTVVDNQEFVTASVNVATQLAHIKTQTPDAIYIISGDTASDTAIVLKIQELGITASLFGSEALKSDTFISDAGDAANGLTLTAITDGTNAYKEKYRAEYNTDAGDYTAQTYDAYSAIALAIKNGARSGTAISKALNSLQFNGASGHIKFDSKGDVPGNYEVIKVQDGKFVPVTD